MHIRKFFTGVCLLFSSSFLQGQNLITNGDFESYSVLPTNYGDFCLVSGWLNPSSCCVLNPNFGTPDYVNKIAAWPVGCPNNGFGTINPRSGNGIVGFTTYANYGTPPVFREYIEKKFTSHLTIGQSYTVAFYIARASAPFFKYATNNIGVYFSTVPTVQTGTSVIPVTPQWEYTSVFSSSSWTLMTFNIIPTDTFNYITIGNFRSDAATTKTIINSSATGLYSHYFVDDVSLISNSPLPIELLSFEVKQDGPRVKAEWSTLSEKDNDYFTLEKSADLHIFTDLLQVESNHNSNIRSDYEAYDEAPHSGTTFYRLRQTDIDGVSSVSTIKSIFIRISNPEPHSWYDQFVNSIQIVMPPGSFDNIGQLTVYDFNGRLVYEQLIQNQERVQIDGSNLSKGVYTIMLKGATSIYKKKLVVF